jgi:hypothetical protein
MVSDPTIDADVADEDGNEGEDSEWWDDAASERLAMWLRLIERAQQLGYVARACEELGVHRTAFYRIWTTWRRGGQAALRDLALRSVARSPEGRQRVEVAVLRITAEHPDWGRKRVARALQDRGYTITPPQVLTVWRRHDLLHPERNPAEPKGE